MYFRLVKWYVFLIEKLIYNSSTISASPCSSTTASGIDVSLVSGEECELSKINCDIFQDELIKGVGDHITGETPLVVFWPSVEFFVGANVTAVCLVIDGASAGWSEFHMGEAVFSFESF